MNFLRSLVVHKKVASIHLFYTELDKYFIDLIVYEKIGNQLVELYSEFKLSSIERIATLITKSIPVVITINGHTVINKVLVSEMQPEKDFIVKTLFSGVKSELFNIQIVTSQTSNTHFISIIRNNILDQILQGFRKCNLKVVAVFLGPHNLNYILEGQISSEFTFDHFELKASNGEILEIKYNLVTTYSSEVSIGNNRFSPSVVIPFTSALSFLLNGPKDNIDNEQLRVLRKEYKLSTKKRKTIITLFLVLFSLIIFERAWSFYLRREYENLSSSLRTIQNKAHQSEKTIQLLTRQRHLLKEYGFLESDNLVYLSNNLGTKLPESLTLSELKINTVDMSIEDNVKMLVRKAIEVRGICDSDLNFNQWIRALKSEAWVKNISEIHYQYDSEFRRGTFKISIEY